jgi:hypothetical protein
MVGAINVNYASLTSETAIKVVYGGKISLLRAYLLVRLPCTGGGEVGSRPRRPGARGPVPACVRLHLRASAAGTAWGCAHTACMHGYRVLARVHEDAYLSEPANADT